MIAMGEAELFQKFLFILAKAKPSNKSWQTS